MEKEEKDAFSTKEEFIRLEQIAKPTYVHLRGQSKYNT